MISIRVMFFIFVFGISSLFDSYKFRDGTTLKSSDIINAFQWCMYQISSGNTDPTFQWVIIDVLRRKFRNDEWGRENGTHLSSILCFSNANKKRIGCMELN